MLTMVNNNKQAMDDTIAPMGIIYFGCMELPTAAMMMR
jgi:hypothetical protein